MKLLFNTYVLIALTTYSTKVNSIPIKNYITSPNILDSHDQVATNTFHGAKDFKDDNLNHFDIGKDVSKTNEFQQRDTSTSGTGLPNLVSNIINQVTNTIDSITSMLNPSATLNQVVSPVEGFVLSVTSQGGSLTMFPASELANVCSLLSAQTVLTTLSAPAAVNAPTNVNAPAAVNAPTTVNAPAAGNLPTSGLIPTFTIPNVPTVGNMQATTPTVQGSPLSVPVIQMS